MQAGQRSLPVETRIPLDYLTSGDALGDYAQMRELCHANPLAAWAAYIGGSIFTLLKEESVNLPYGFSFLLLSAVPMNVGIGSSAAVEIGTLSLPQRLPRPATGRRAHRPAGPDGGKPRRRRALRHHGPDRHHQRAAAAGSRTSSAGPARSSAKWKFRPAPASSASTRWSATPSPAIAYGDVRIGAFMGKKIINEIRARTGRARAELSDRNFRRRNCKSAIPAAKFPKRFSARNFWPNTKPTTIR